MGGSCCKDDTVNKKSEIETAPNKTPIFSHSE